MKKIYLTIAAFLLMLTSCGHIDNERPYTPDDFEIYFAHWIGEEQKNIIDTYNSVIQKDLVTDGVASCGFIPTDEELNRLYCMTLEFDLNEIDIVLDSEHLTENSEELVEVSPKTYYELKYTANGKTHTIKGDATMDAYIKSNKKADNFRNFIIEINKFVIETDEYKSLPEANGGYE